MRVRSCILGSLVVDDGAVCALRMPKAQRAGEIMNGAHCGKYMVTQQDTCLFITKRCTVCKRRFTQRKRRPAGVGTHNCTWKVHCTAHPGKTGTDHD